VKLVLIVPGGVDRSGRERVVPALLWLIERLAVRHQVTVIQLYQEPVASQFTWGGATIVNLGNPTQPWLGRKVDHAIGQTRRLLAYLRAQPWQADLLHALWVGATGLMTVMAGRRLGIPTLLTLWAGELVWLPQIRYGGLGTPWQRLKVRWMLRWATDAAVGSRYMAGLLPPWRQPVHWAPLGVDRSLFSTPSAPTPGPPWRLLHVASLNRVKDPFTLLRALQQVVAVEPGVHLDWIGEDTLQGAVQRFAADLALLDHVTFHGFQPTDIVTRYVQQSHLYLQASLHEGQGVAVLEAAAGGVPTVGTAVGVVAEMAPTAALAVPPADPQALAQGILHLLAHPAERVALGQAARQWAQRYDADWTAQTYETIYQQLQAPQP
jgi:glycosyltransferase involved in cell wall biosynthesis